MHHLKPFAIVVLNGEITVYSVDTPNGFEWYVSQCVYKILFGSFQMVVQLNTKPCLDTSKW